MCGPYSINPFKCIADGLSKGVRVHTLYAFGLTRHLHRDDTPPCMGGRKGRQPITHWDSRPLALSERVETYVAALMRRLKLRANRFVAIQYRMGVEWKKHVSSPYVGSPWACYGAATINRSLAKVVDAHARSLPIFYLTNQVRLHDDTVPVPVGVLAEARIASLAYLSLLNARSSFVPTVRRLRIADGAPTGRVHVVGRGDVVDSCDVCGAFDERASLTLCPSQAAAAPKPSGSKLRSGSPKAWVRN